MEELNGAGLRGCNLRGRDGELVRVERLVSGESRKPQEADCGGHGHGAVQMSSPSLTVSVYRKGAK